MRTTTIALSISFLLLACGDDGLDRPGSDAAIATVDAGPDAGGGASRDAGVISGDASGEIDYEVAYVDELTFAPSGTNLDSVLGLIVVVNTGSAPLDLATASVVTSSDDSDEVEWTLSRYSGSNALLDPGHAAGCLSPLAVTTLITGGLVSEPGGGCADYDQGLDFEMRFSRVPPAGVTYHAQALLRIEGVDLVVPFTIHGAETYETSGVVFNGASRIGTGS